MLTTVGDHREEGYVNTTSADMVSLEMTPDPDKLRRALFLTVGDTWPKIFNKTRQEIFGQGTRLFHSVLFNKCVAPLLILYVRGAI